VFSTPCYCAGGLEIWVEFLAAPGGGRRARYSDEEHPELALCQECGRRLDHEDMEAI